MEFVKGVVYDLSICSSPMGIPWLGVVLGAGAAHKQPRRFRKCRGLASEPLGIGPHCARDRSGVWSAQHSKSPAIAEGHQQTPDLVYSV